MEEEYDVFSGAAATYAEVLGKKGLSEYRRLAEAAFPKLSPRGRKNAYDQERSRLSHMMDYFAERDGDLAKRAPIDRPRLDRTEALAAAYRAAMARAGANHGDVAASDFYSCFSIPVFAAAEALGLHPADPRGFTVRGGLPFFGGPGNNYSILAIAEMARRLRSGAGGFGVVGAIGCFLSWHSIGDYSATPPRKAYAREGDAALKAALDAAPSAYVDTRPDGAPVRAFIFGWLRTDGARSAATASDSATLARLADADPLGAAVRAAPAKTGASCEICPLPRSRRSFSSPESLIRVY
jgi:hypothetical protein